LKYWGFYAGLTTEVVTKERWYKYIVIHHTATEKIMSAETMKLSMERTWVNNRWWTHIPTHYIVWSSGDFIKVNDMNLVVWATRSDDANWNWIHIEVVWDFNKSTPSDAQYNMVRQLISWIEEKHPDLEIKWHKDFQNHTCPWKNFDMGRLTWKQEITFKLSRYYSVIVWQTRYYNNKTYEDDFKMNCHWDCLSTANGTKLTDKLKYKSVACPPEYPLWTKIQLEWIWIVTCNDRGGAIQGNRIDMWCWIWDDALDNWNKCPTGERMWFVITL